MNTQSVFYNVFAALLKVALVVALVAAVWNIYRHLPDTSQEQGKLGTNVAEETSLQIILREPLDNPRVPAGLPVVLDPIDYVAVRKEFLSEPRPGKRLEDFLAEHRGNRALIEARLDENGQVTVVVKSGPWWIRTILPGEPSIEWHLRVNVSGQKQTVELTTDNAYTRMKSF